MALNFKINPILGYVFLIIFVIFLGIMGLCYICNGKLFGKQNKVCSGVLPYSNSSYKDKIADILGDEFFVIVTPVDHLCEDCTTLLIRVDKDESDLKLIKDSFVSSILKKHGFLPASIHDKTSNVSI